MRTPTIKTIVKKIKFPVSKWPGNCFGVATKIVEAGIINGKVIYGQYHGPIAEGGYFKGGFFHHHAWIEVDEKIIDPTRWVFENLEPYVYICDNDNQDYDLGGNRLKLATMLPFPAFKKEQRTFVVPKTLKGIVARVTETPATKLCSQQICWIGALPIQILGPDAKAVYEWIEKDVKMVAFIPIDNYQHVLGS